MRHPFGLNFGGFLGWLGWLFIPSASSPATATASAIFGWWFAFTRDLRRERTFTIDDLPAAASAYSDPGEPGHPASTGP
jgi:hypothetical protein